MVAVVSPRPHHGINKSVIFHPPNSKVNSLRTSGSKTANEEKRIYKGEMIVCVRILYVFVCETKTTLKVRKI